MGKYGVLSERELEARYEVGVEQYGIKLNIESETAASIARTMLLPAAVRHLNELLASGRQGLIDEVAPLIERVPQGDHGAREGQRGPGPGGHGARRVHARHGVPAMADVRAVADRLERLVADDLWPLPKYSEILFIK